MKRWAFSGVVSCIVALSPAWAQDTTFVGIVGAAGVAVHQAEFGSLPGIPSCCKSYGTQMLPSVSIGGMVERRIGTIGGLPAFLQLRAGVHALGGVLEREEMIANVIVGDRLVEGRSRYHLQVQLWTASVEPLLRVPLPTPIIAADIGARLDFIPPARFTQREELVSPASGVVFETGTTTRNNASGIIPTAARVGAALSLGVSTTVMLNSSWSLRPELRGHVGISRLADVPWYVHRLTAGVAFVHSIAPAVPPAPPALPPEPLLVQVQAQLLGIHHMEGDTAIVDIPARRIIRRALLVPAVFFPSGSSQLDSAARAHLQRVARAARQHNIALHLQPSIAPGEHDTLAVARMHAVESALRAEGVSVTGRVQSRAFHSRASSPDELRAVWIHSSSPLVEEETESIPLAEPAVTLFLQPKISGAVGTPSLYASVVQDGASRSFALSLLAPAQVNFSPARVLAGKESRYRWHVIARDSLGRTAEHRGEGILRPHWIERDTTTEGMDNGGLLLLGLCGFDSATFEVLDTTAVRVIQQAVRRGARVVLIGSTDSIGTDAYNRALARRRVESALVVLGVPASQVHIEERIGGPSSSGTLYARLASRGVFARIEEQ
ncbi:MAG: hypothetical protein NZ481_05830 [Candidatus Kapabacteria bacterium]|nr:hypothetical protein [Candidatus Kapabacteria bacterium]